MNLTEISQYRTSALCSTETPPPIGRLPIIDPTDAASAAENPAWHQYIAAVYPGSTAVRDLNTFTFFYWFAPLRVTAFCVAAWKDRKPELEDGTPWQGGADVWGTGPGRAVAAGRAAGVGRVHDEREGQRGPLVAQGRRACRGGRALRVRPRLIGT